MLKSAACRYTNNIILIEMVCKFMNKWLSSSLNKKEKEKFLDRLIKYMQKK
jgi:hypothetical protein